MESKDISKSKTKSIKLKFVEIENKINSLWQKGILEDGSHIFFNDIERVYKIIQNYFNIAIIFWLIDYIFCNKIYGLHFHYLFHIFIAFTCYNIINLIKYIKI